MVGIENRESRPHFNGPVKTEVVDPTHPITRDLPSTWELDDESYTMNEPVGPNVQVLLTTRHEPSMQSIAWTNLYKNSRVFCYQSGHGPPVYAEANFRKVLSRGIRWVAKRG
jgi:type 1 glutamine amidotransferase